MFSQEQPSAPVLHRQAFYTCSTSMLTAHAQGSILTQIAILSVAPLQDNKVYTFEELSDSSAALISQRHTEMRDAGKEIGKLLSSSNRVLKVCLCCCYRRAASTCRRLRAKCVFHRNAATTRFSRGMHASFAGSLRAGSPSTDRCLLLLAGRQGVYMLEGVR
eukprot:GHRQ01038493.1.p1 GENE.GHRQ01038493.1~~GHRQ01038493.1.p1  ORF type:complete len:162 (-),score=23.31 GHRQ01038493.1:33-518(-)